MKKLLLLTILCFTPWLMEAQTVKGKVVNEQQKPIDYAEIYLFRDNNDFIKQAFSDIDGIFSLEIETEGNYSLQINYAGKQLYKQPIHIQNTVDLGTIQLDTQTQLDEVVIQAERKLVERKVDRLVYNTANSIASQGMDALEALATTPMVKVKDDKISIVGKSNVRIMIDDRMLELTGDALTNYLRTLRSDDIEKIEVITTPSAKYEASGNGGIINIVLKKNKRMGVYGTVSSNYSYNNYNVIGGNGSLNYQNKKWSIMLKGNVNNNNTNWSNDATYQDKDKFMSNDKTTTNLYKNRNISMTTNYQLTENSLIGGSYDFTKVTSNPIALTKSIYKSAPFIINDSIINSINSSNSKNLYHTANVFFDQKLDTLGSKLSIGANYFSNEPDQTYDIKDYNTLSALSKHTSYSNYLKYQVYSFNADLNYHLSWAEIELGTKYTNFDNKASVVYFDIKNNTPILDLTKSNRFNYNENNYAAYFSLSKKLSTKWSVKGGMRYEHTNTIGELLDTNEEFTKSYGKFFPTAYISFTPNETHSFSFNYSKRINRPYSDILNPFKYYSNNFTYFQGNPNLAPSYNNNYELSYVFKGALSINLNYYHMTDSFDQLGKYENGIYSSTTYNMLNSDNYGIDASYNSSITPWWETNTGADYIISAPYYRAKEATQIGQKGNTFSYYSQNTFNINPSKTVKLMLNWYHQLPNKEDNTQYSAYSSLLFGTKLALLNKKMNINMSISDVFNTGKSYGTMYYKDNVQTFSNSWNSRRFNLSVSYTFGDSNNKKSIKEASFEDSQRSKQ